jgi:hypothetical protein
MNTRLLRLARRHSDGVRQWSVPGAPNAVKLVPGRLTVWGIMAAHWPAIDKDGDWIMRGCRLDWHRSVAKAEIRKLIEGVAA